MSYDYSGLKANASELITRFGAGITLTQPETTDTDPLTGETVVTQAAVGYTPSAVIQRYALSEIDGTLIKRGDRRLLVEAFGTEPQTDWKATVGGTVYQVIDVEPLEPSGDAVVYKVQVRK